MPSVAPEPPDGMQDLPKLMAPIPLKPTPMTDWDPLFVQRRKEISEKILKLKSGRQLAYFTEGSPTDPAVLCLHSLGMSKTQYLLKKPLAGIFQICVDRQGHGNSSPYPRIDLSNPIQFSTHVHEYVELLDSLGVDKFYVTGSSMGASWTIALAAALPDRCIGAAPMSAMPDPWRANMTPALRKPLCPEGATLLLSMGDRSCKGSMRKSTPARCTVPAQSTPGAPASPGYAPSTLSTSRKLSPTARTLTSASPSASADANGA